MANDVLVLGENGPELVGDGSKVNYFALLVGPPEHGKSSLLLELAIARAHAGSFVIMQDTNREMGHRFPSFLTGAEFRKWAAQQDPEQPAPTGVAIACPDGADELVALALELGGEWNQAFGATRQPIALVLNEVSALVESGPTHVGPQLRRLMNQRRHLGIEPIFGLQHAAQLPASAWDVVTDVYMFAQRREDRVDALEKHLSIPRGQLAFLATLPVHRYAHWNIKTGLAGKGTR